MTAPGGYVLIEDLAAPSDAERSARNLHDRTASSAPSRPRSLTTPRPTVRETGPLSGATRRSPFF